MDDLIKRALDSAAGLDALVRRYTGRHYAHSDEATVIHDLVAHITTQEARLAQAIKALEYCGRNDGAHPENRRRVAEDALRKIRGADQ